VQLDGTLAGQVAHAPALRPVSLVTPPVGQRGCVVVTGASTGIGLDASRELAAHGFRVFGSVRRQEDGRPLEQAGVTPLLLDVTDETSIRAARDRVGELLDGASLVGLVNNAGITSPGPVELLDLDEFRRVFEVNVLGVVAVTKAFLPLLKKSRGRIVNMSSVSGQIATPFIAPYVASKFALEAISDCLRRELHPFGVDVIVIQPGNVRTPIWRKSIDRDLSPVLNTPYERVITKMRDHAALMEQTAMPPSRVSEAILHALTADRPATRILVVRKAWVHRIQRLIPDRVMDRKIAQLLWS
jgi:NAD(P)-dependent dehydrogenase (short-subunit alcohol dehydrogenase family)